jgi:hypothetical protein
LITFAGSSGEAAESSEPITDANKVLAIYTNDRGLRPAKEPMKLILAIWGDGRIVWSEDSLQGGAPYRSARINPKRVATLLAGLEKGGYFDNPALNRSYFGPDSQFTTIYLKSGKKKLKMQSWHERFEANGKTVMNDRGAIEGLAGRKRLQVLAKLPPEQLFFRLVWAELRAAAVELIPKKGDKTSGGISVKHGVVSWQTKKLADKGRQ